MLSLIRSNAFKIALAFAGTVVVTTSLVFGIVYIRFYAANVRFVGAILQDEVQKVRDFPIEKIKARLDLRLTQDLHHLDYVGLYDKNGNATLGNVGDHVQIPPNGKAFLVRTGQVGGTLTKPWQKPDALFVASTRPDGETLVLGRSLVYIDQLERTMSEAFAVAVVPAIVLALLAGTIVSLRASQRLSNIQKAINRVMQGDLHVRLPARRRQVDDIDELVRAVNAMLDEIVRLLNQLKSVGDNIAHDLRAPLAVMRARLERGLAGNSEDILRALTAEALSDLARAMTTVTALLRISELESGLRRSAFDDVDLVAVCRDAFDLFEPLAAVKGVDMTLDTPAPVLVTGDGDLLREALSNLIDNAIKFTPSGGSIVVACGRPGVLMQVGDTGPGIAPEEREKIFKRFYRSRSTDQTPGVGLGLSMATTILDLHGFGLRIRDNAPGAVFEITPKSTSVEDTCGDSKHEKPVPSNGVCPASVLIASRNTGGYRF